MGNEGATDRLGMGLQDGWSSQILPVLTVIGSGLCWLAKSNAGGRQRRESFLGAPSSMLPPFTIRKRGYTFL
jgi:hypothetical protein